MTNKKQPETFSEALENFKSALIDTVAPALERMLRAVSKVLNDLEEFIMKLENDRNKRIVLNRKLNNLTDPTLLDRMIQGEKQ